MDYYSGVAGKQEGPMPEEELRRRIAAGSLGGGDLCWSAGWPEWRKVRDAFPDAFAMTNPPPVPSGPVVMPDPSMRSGGAAQAPTSSSVPATASLRGTDAPRTSPLAIWSLVLGFLGCFFGIPSIILGHMARAQIKKSNGQLTGSGIALAGLILGYLTIPAYLVFVFVVWAHDPRIHDSLRVREKADAAGVEADDQPPEYDVSQGNLRQIALACLIYGYRHNGRLPESVDEIRGLFGDQFAAVMDLPYTTEIETDGYTIVPGVTTSRPLSTVIAYEATARGDGSRAVAYLDGHVAILDEEDAAALEDQAR